MLDDIRLTYHPSCFRGTSSGENLRPVYFRKQAHILLCHSRNLHGISDGVSSCLLEESGVYPVIPPTQLMWHVKGIFLVNIQQHPARSESLLNTNI